MTESPKKEKIHPTINRCMEHLKVLEVDNKVRQVVYMYMESLYRETENPPEEAEPNR
ncbi:hypothetical protein [Bacillus marinisedimentorum]|uniref:hypothetical protein n=1 Tax=Bacillus marinisedimentorum TaxID=1821260 RepID=UPI0012FFCF74|nr:hypothetical protein [Bacillus marinisedimentorum]